MRREIILSVLLLCAVTLQAKNQADDVRLFGAKCDSIRDMLTEWRSEYARRASSREDLSPKIIKAESELRRYTDLYNKAVQALSKAEGELSLNNFIALQNSAKATVVKVDTTAMATPAFTSNTKRDLVTNSFFSSQLSENDYQTLQEAQQSEMKAVRVAEAYSAHYAELLSLHRKYMEVNTSQKADSVALLFNAKLREMAQSDSELSTLTSALYFNKNYIYDLLMERGGHRAMLDLSASLSTAAEREIESNSGVYISDALTAYHLRKRALVEYELQLADLLSASNARDSLKRVANELKQRDFKLSKLELHRRNFIDYQPITIKSTTYYNSKNPIPQTKIYDYGTIYRIRIGLFKRRPNVAALRGVTPLSYTDIYNDGLYAYFVGAFATEQEAQEGVAQLKKLGFREPIIAVWVDGEYYPTLDMMRQSLNQYNIEISGIATLSEEMKAKIVQYNADCTISRIGSNFVVGLFDRKADAERLSAELKALNSDITTRIIKKP